MESKLKREESKDERTGRNQKDLTEILTSLRTGML